MDGENGMKPAWLLRHLLANEMDVYEDKRLKAVSFVYMNSKSSLFQVKTEPIEGRGFALGARVRIRCTYQMVRRKQVNQKAKALFTELEK